MDFHRIRLIIEYDGTNYAGWQRQQNALGVQQKLEEALRKLTNEADLFIVGASRTDAGVHALHQNAHFDTRSRIPPEKIAFAVNTMLPPDIRVVESIEVPADFHARFSAVGKEYIYLIHNSRHSSAVYRNLTCHVSYPLNIDKMRAEAALAIGVHDFAAFAAAGSTVKDTVRAITSIEIEKTAAEISLRVRGGGFLYNMVRILAGTLIAVGANKIESGAITRALDSLSRLDLGATAPACGLYLSEVFYPDRFITPRT